MRNRVRWTLFGIVTLVVNIIYADVAIKNMTAQQRYPWNGKVDIVVTISGDVSEVANYECTFVATNSATKAAVPVMAITQVGGDSVSGDVCTRRYIWNAKNDVSEVKIEDLALTVDVKELGVQLWANGPYWAECNVGASKPEEYGYYFWWGDTVGYKRNAANDGWVSVNDGTSFSFSSGNCPTYGKDCSTLQSLGYIDLTGNLVAAHDAATAHLGAPWRMPTSAEIGALVSNCTTTWTTRNGVYGRLVTGKGDYAAKSIFLPAAGYGNGPYLSITGSYGYHWSSTPYSDYPRYAWYLYFSSSNFYRNNYDYRLYGQSVRPLRGFTQGASSMVMGAGETTRLTLDCRTDVRTMATDGEALLYDTSWYDNATIVKLYDNGSLIGSGTKGTLLWTSEVCGDHMLTLRALSSDGSQVASESVAFFEAHKSMEAVAATAATCTATGHASGTRCSVCGTVLSGCETIAALGHVEVVTTAAKEPTCTKTGCTKGSYCSRCNTVLATSTTIPALGHVEQVTTAAKAATCTENGCTKGAKCSRCNAVLATSTVLSAFGHSGTITKVAVEPTSGKAGSTAEIRCSRCNALLQAATAIPALGYIRNVTARQIWPYQKVEVCYDLAADIGEVASAASVTLKAKYGSTTKTAATVLGNVMSSPGRHCIVWDMGSDRILINQSAVTFTVGIGTASGTSVATQINTSGISEGMNVGGVVDLGYTDWNEDGARLYVDGSLFLSATNSGSFAWQPRTKGTHKLKHVPGNWTKTVNVTSLVYEEPTPNPPTTEDANFTITTTVRALTSTAKASGVIATAKIDSSYTGTWSATTSADWITLTYATRNVGLPVIYTVAENKGVETRTGYVYVSGHVFTITQPGVGAELDRYLAAFDQNGGEGTVTVLAGSQSGWRARSNVDWISVETLCGTGECEMVYHVASWNEVSTRNGTITVAGKTFTVNQVGRPMRLSADSAEKDYLAHDIVLTVDALASTAWGIALDASWLSIVSGGSGKGAGTITLAINENPSYLSRTATALIGIETFTIVQTGRPAAALAFAISPEATTASVKGANGVIAIEATPDLPWSATSQASWLTVMPGFSSGAGNGNVVYTATPNPTMAKRSGSIRVVPEAASGVAAKTHSVTQPAATSMISVDNHTFAVDGDSFAVEVSVDDVVAWTIVENVDWLSVDGATSRNGPDSVTIAVEPNMSIELREATITIAGHAFHVTQRGRTISLEYGETVFPPDEFEEATIEVHPNGEVEWTAVPSDATWISIWSEDENCVNNPDGSVSGTGDATLKYMVTAYVGDGEVKTGWITIGNEKIYVSQRAYELSIDPCATNVAGNAGAGSVAVPATAGQVWNAIATEPWIKLVGNYDEVTGSGTINYTFTDNDTGETRTGKIVIAGEEYTVTQAARQLVQVEVEVEGGGEVEVEKVGGGGQRNVYSFDRGTTVELTAVASNDWRFVRWEKSGSAIGDGTPTLPVTADVDQEIVAVFEAIPVYTVNGESVKDGTVMSFAAPEAIVMGGTTQLVCLGTSVYPNKGTSFQMQITGNIDFDWDLWQTNYLVAISQTAGGTVSGTTGWVAAGTEATFTATPAAGKSLYRWSGFDGGRGATALPSVSSPVSRPMTISAVFGTFADTLATAADAPALTFTTGGEAVWTSVIDATAQTGCSSIKSGAIGTESESWVETTVFGTGTLAFRWKTDCEHDDGGEATWDRLAVFVNGVEKARLDGTTDWRSVALPLVVPKTTVRWSFYRDDYDADGANHENCGWIDSVEVK